MNNYKIENDTILIDKNTSLVPALCSNVEARKVKFLNGVKAIPYALFAKNVDIKTLELNDDLESISDRAFYACVSLHYVIIPEGVKDIGKDAFGFCPALDTIACSEEMYEKKDLWLGDNPGTKSIIVYDIKKNYAKEIRFIGYSNKTDSLGNKIHKIILDEVKSILRSKGITCVIDHVSEIEYKKPAEKKRKQRKIDYELKRELEKQIFAEPQDSIEVGR